MATSTSNRDSVLSVFSRQVAEKILISGKKLCKIGPAFLQKSRLDVRFARNAEDMAECLLVQMSNYVVGMPREVIAVYRRYPRDWWEAFKERWFPRFLLRRYPVQYVVIDIYQPIYGPVCPHLEVPDEQMHLEWISEKRKPVEEVSDGAA